MQNCADQSPSSYRTAVAALCSARAHVQCTGNVNNGAGVAALTALMLPSRVVSATAALRAPDPSATDLRARDSGSCATAIRSSNMYTWISYTEVDRDSLVKHKLHVRIQRRSVSSQLPWISHPAAVDACSRSMKSDSSVLPSGYGAVAIDVTAIMITASCRPRPGACGSRRQLQQRLRVYCYVHALSFLDGERVVGAATRHAHLRLQQGQSTGPTDARMMSLPASRTPHWHIVCSGPLLLWNFMHDNKQLKP